LAPPASPQKPETALVLEQEQSDPLADVDGFLASMEAYASMGIDLVEVMPLVEDPVAWAGQLGGSVVPRLAELGA